MNIYDISQKAGVSTATVSRVLNQSTKVTEKTRNKVLAAIEECGYTPNAFARGLGLNTMKTVGIMCADSSDPYFARAIYFLGEALRKSGYDVILSCTGFDQDMRERQMSLLLNKRVDSVILIGSNYTSDTDENNRYITDAAKSIPVMMINGNINASNVYCIASDDRTAVFDVTSQLISSGRNRPLYIYNSRSYGGIQKLRGFRDALKNNRIKADESNELFIGFRRSGGEIFPVKEIKKSIEDHFAKYGSFDCIIAAEDIIAVGALKFASSNGITVPDKLAVAGYNNFELCECCEPELTSVDNHLELLCDKCVSLLMEVFSGESIPKQTVFSCNIIERATTDLKERPRL